MALLSDPLDALVGASAAMVAVRERVRTVLTRPFGARRPPSLLLRGETGTGKGLLARACHQAGPRAGRPFVTVNCAAIPESLLEAELFGFERGAFTDARQGKPGLFHSAGAGTILLDEIGLLAESLQAKLLTFLDDRLVRRLGSTRAEAVDLWVMAATSVDLETAVRDGRFREDLYHRLAVLSVRLPPLREREGDIFLLADLFVAQVCRDYGLPKKSLTADAQAALLVHPWPGNVRELANVIERAVLVSDTTAIDAGLLALPDRRGAPAGQTARAARVEPDTASAPLSGGYRSPLDRLERAQLLEALEGTGWNISHAAEQLGVPRNTLRYRIAKHQLERTSRGPRQRVEPRRGRFVGPSSRASEGTPAAEASRLRPVTLLRVRLAQPGTTVSPWISSEGVDLVAEKVVSFGGSVVMRDDAGLSAAFGLEPTEDAPARAAGVAMAVRRLVERAQLRHPGVGAVCAIETLPCRTERHGEEARLEAGAIQEAEQTLCALIQGTHGDIVLGPAVASHLERHFVLSRNGPSRAGGPSQLVRRDRVEGEPGDASPGRRHSPFVGRTQEITFLERRLRHVAITGKGHVVGLMGEPGMGKSRVLAELQRLLLGQAASILVGRCASHSAAVPYSLLVDLVRRAWHLDDTDTPDMVSSAVSEQLSAIGLRECLPEILALLGLDTDVLAPLSSEAVRTRTFEALRRFLLAHARSGPLALLLEDLHWIDQTSQQFLGLLADSLPGSRVLVVATTRPGYRAPWSDRSWASQIALPPLTLDDSQDIIRALRPDLSEASIEAIARRAEGNPFFLEELASVVGDSAAPEALIPGTVVDVLRARMDRLPRDARRVLDTAAVLGREASLALLELITEVPAEKLAAPLARLVAAEFLYEQPGTTFVFKHALTQEVAYCGVAAADRIRLHASAGRAIEQLFVEHTDEVLYELAHHWGRTEDHARAVGYLRRLGDRAIGACAPVESAAALEQALTRAEQLPEGPERERAVLSVVVDLPMPLMVLGRIEEVRTLLLQYQARVEQLDDPRLSGAFFSSLAFPYDHRGMHRDAESLALRGLASATRAHDEMTMGMALMTLTHSSLWAGRFAEGLERADRAVQMLTKPGAAAQFRGVALWVKAHHEILRGDFNAGLTSAAALWELGERTENSHCRSCGTCIPGWVLALRGDSEAALERCGKALEMASTPITKGIVLGYVGEALGTAGRYREAREHLAESVDFCRRFGFPQLIAWNLTRLSLAEKDAGDLRTAHGLADEAARLACQVKFPFAEALAGRVLGLVAQLRQDLDAATGHLAEACAILDRLDARYHSAVVRLDLARSLATTGSRESAVIHLVEAARRFRELDIPVWLQRAAAAASQLGVAIDEPAG
jgi:two-component system, NtrC family, response regulator AtoC